MKWYGHFAIAVWIIFFIVFIVAVSDLDYIDKKTNKQIFGYDCAKNFDKAVAVSDLSRSVNLLESLHQNQNIQSHQFLKFGELLDNRCFITVKNWASNSNYEVVIWQNNWERLSYVNQLWVHEAECVNLEMCKAVIGIKFLIDTARENSDSNNKSLGNQIKKQIPNAP